MEENKESTTTEKERCGKRDERGEMMNFIGVLGAWHV